MVYKFKFKLRNLNLNNIILIVRVAPFSSLVTVYSRLLKLL